MIRPFIATAFLLAAGSASADDCEFTAPRNLELPQEAATRLNLLARAGDLRVTGVPGAKQIELRGRACASSAEALAQLNLVHSREGSTLNVSATAPAENSGFKLFGSNYAYIDLEVRMPQGMLLDLDDSSGDIEIVDAGAIDLRDSSGDIDIRGARGDVAISDSSGDIEIDQADGSVTVRSDSSGDIRIQGVRRDVSVEEDSSGDIRISDVTGSARVDHDSSGDIRFKHIGGNAEVGSDSSGSVGADDIKGDFTVREKSGGSSAIEHSDVGGKVSVPQHD